MRRDARRWTWCLPALFAAAIATIVAPQAAAQSTNPTSGPTERPGRAPLPTLLLPGQSPAVVGSGAPGGWHATLPGLELDAGLGPVGFADLADHGDRDIARAVRALWIDRIEARGRERGSTYLGAGLGVGRGPWAFVLESETFAEVDLSPGAAELLLFGNAGRTGEPRDLDVAGSAFSAVATTSVGLAHARTLSRSSSGETVTMEGRFRWVVANALYLGRGAEGGTATEPPGVDLEFPIVETLGDAPFPGGGGGAGVDLALAWRDAEGRWEAGAAVLDLVSTLRWRSGDLAFRPGTAFFDERSADTEFGKRPVAGAELDPTVARLVERAERLRFQPLVRIGVALQESSDWRYSAAVERTPRDGIRGRVGNSIQVGAEWSGFSRLDTRAVVRRETGETHLTLGGSLRIRALTFEGIWGYRSGAGIEGEVVGFAVRWSSR